MDYSNWMGSTTAIHGLPLGNICLPASHDSGTYGLTTRLTQDLDADEQKIVTLLQGIAAKIQDIPGVAPYVPDAYAWIYDAVILTLRNLLTANATSVSQQLADGIRCLDLRVYLDSASQQFYTYHTLIGTPLPQVLDEIAAFLSSTSGEIVYVTCGHFRGFAGGADPGFMPFNDLLIQKLGQYSYPQCLNASQDQIVNPVFQQTYDEIISNGGPGSKAILVNAGYSTLSDLETFWPRTYSPPDDEGNGGIVAGDYANSSDLTTMRSFQTDEYDGRGSLPFALYMLLTPQASDVTGVVARVLATALYRQVDRISSEAPAVGAALQAIAASLTLPAPEWTTLQQLSLDVDTNIGSNISRVVGTLPSPNPLSLIYVDFHDVTNIVDLAIQYSTGQPGRAA
jgi:hypothetical protein